MNTCDALWEVFKATGHIGAYLLYKDYQTNDDQTDKAVDLHCLRFLEAVKAE